jgi:hypothetical protein
MAEHAKLSASGSKRWLSCPPSSKLEEQFPQTTSEYAAEGTFAHSLAEHKLKCYISVISKSKREKAYEQLKKDKYYSPDLESYVDVHVDFVKERINAALAKTKDAVTLLEQRLDFSEWVPDGFGTGDVVIIADGYIEIIDLKFGKGVSVEAEGNTQMQLYALGAYSDFSLLYDIDTVKMTICQPRLDSISSQEMPIEELLAWGNDVVKPIAEKAIKGEGEYKAGAHCQFCRAKAVCKARAEENLKMAKYDFMDPDLLSDEEIGEILVQAEELQKWAKDIQSHALEQAELHGKKWPGWKLVEGRSNRKYTDADEVAKVLLAAEYKEDTIYAPREILGITAMEKAITKKKFNELLSSLVVKPAGKPTLVPESDKRPEISSANSAKADFSEAV